MQEGRKEYRIFTVICIFASACFLILSLLYSLKLQSVAEKTYSIVSICGEIEEENRLLSIKLEEKYSIAWLEDHARRELKMHSADNSSTVHIEKIS